MPYTPLSLTIVWLVTLTLFVLVGSGAVQGRWVFALIPIGMAAPALLRKRA